MNGMENGKAYFTLEPRPDGVFRISEPLGVGESLIVGSERALLIDTGYGLADMRPTLAQATDRPVVVMNTHVHTDHSGGNGWFGRVFVPAGERAKVFDGSLERERAGLFRSLYRNKPHLREFLVPREEPDAERPDTVYEPLPERFDLGDRTVEMFVLGGHTSSSTAVIDRASGTAFVGDAVGPQVWLFLNQNGKMRDYVERLRTFSALRGIDRLQLSHKDAPIPFSFAAYYADFIGRVDPRRAQPWPNDRFAVPVFRYAESRTPYGEVSVLFCESNL